MRWSADNSTTNFAKYGFEVSRLSGQTVSTFFDTSRDAQYMPSYINGFGTGWITWSEEDQRTWQIRDRAMSANAAAQVSDRPVTGEPLSIVLNLGLSDNFGWVDEENLEFPGMCLALAPPALGLLIRRAGMQLSTALTR